MTSPLPQALYYPYSRALSAETLKRAVLLFEKVLFLDSEPWFVRNELLHSEKARVLRAVEDDYAYLRDEEVIAIVDPSDQITTYDTLLTANVRHDIGDDHFLEEAVSSSATAWDVLAARLPPSFTQAFYAGAGTFSESLSLQAIVAAARSGEMIPEHVQRFREFRWPSDCTPEQALEMLQGRYRYVVGGNPHIQLKSYELPFAHASSLRINEALVLCALKGAVPFTDSTIHDRLLRLKAISTMKGLDRTPELRERLGIDLPVQLPAEALTMRVLDRLVSSDALASRSIQEVLAYRRTNDATLKRLHVRLAALGASIESVEPGADFERRLRRVINTDVVPEIQAAADDLEASYESSFGKLAVTSVTSSASAAAGVSLSLLGGLGIWAALAAGALAAVGGAAVHASDKIPEAIVDVWMAKRGAERSNAFAYLTKFG